ncbi:uncharacterized protein LOC113040581 [Carassius auratus]|uniref:Uncharacterized protein LOC113040581 n=1 Tax=Carassius auratus TaxID=7957 RepID=A0A6P6J3J3_CARAU|nr:uncharacterized protein LOC113040581 [Carassius auratus]
MCKENGSYCPFVLLGVVASVFGDTVKVESVSVLEGDSVTLDSGFTEMMDEDLILWRFGSENTLIAEISVMTNSMTVYDDDLAEINEDEVTYIEPTFYKRQARTPDVKEDDHVEYAPINKSMFGETDEVTSVSVTEGDSVTLETGFTEIMDDDLILWRFGTKNTLIAEINVTTDRFTIYDNGPDGRFRDRLTVDHQTGSLTITDIIKKHCGLYKLQSNRVSKTFSLAVYARLPVRAISRNSRSSSSSSSSSEYEQLNFTKFCQARAEVCVQCCDTVEAVIRLVVTALMGVAAAAAVVVLVNDIRSYKNC